MVVAYNPTNRTYAILISELEMADNPKWHKEIERNAGVPRKEDVRRILSDSSN